MENQYYPYVNGPLSYAYDALEPWIDAKTMKLHHDRHLQTYIDGLNGIMEENPQLQKLSLRQLILQVGMLPQWLQRPVRNQAGGVYNHRFFFEGMKPCQKENSPSKQMMANMVRDFGGFEAFQRKFKDAALSVFGSGYVWLVRVRGRMRIITTANQNTPLAHGVQPLLCLDVWEHAYYLKHYNKRGDYVDDWYHVIDWSKVEKRILVI
ncbi:MAG: superoxide dismutase [Firmicutes bacterium]|nr:superoxide dismutase [Bacillota bacterium]